MLCCNTVLTVTEGRNGNYCINSPARCFLGFADRAVRGRHSLHSCAGQIKPSALGHCLPVLKLEITPFHTLLPKACFPNV